MKWEGLIPDKNNEDSDEMFELIRHRLSVVDTKTTHSPTPGAFLVEEE